MRAAVAIGAVETEGDDAMLAEGAFERGDRFGCVISHVLTVALLPVPVWGNRCATLEQEPLLPGECRWSILVWPSGSALTLRLTGRIQLTTLPAEP